MTTFKCPSCGARWSEGPTRDHCEAEPCRQCLSNSLAKRAVEVDKLTETVKAMREDRRAVHRMLVCVGGPLNDNVLQFNREQLKLFYRIEECVGPLGGDDEDES